MNSYSFVEYNREQSMHQVVSPNIQVKPVVASLIRTNKASKYPATIPAVEFEYDPVNNRCFCPAGNEMWFRHEGVDANGNARVFFEGRLTDCRHCPKKHDCMRIPDSANGRKGHGR